MTSFECNGVLVDFPYEPYDVQKRYMEKVLECLQNVCMTVLLSFVVVMYVTFAFPGKQRCAGITDWNGKNVVFVVFVTGLAYGKESCDTS